VSSPHCPAPSTTPRRISRLLAAGCCWRSCYGPCACSWPRWRCQGCCSGSRHTTLHTTPSSCSCRDGPPRGWSCPPTTPAYWALWCWRLHWALPTPP
jgi:hypothetical protein